MASKIALIAGDATLREKKYAKTKVALALAFIDRLHHSCFEDLSIREICRDLEISEGTFFNYFDEKVDVLNYYLHLADLKIIWRTKRDAPHGNGLATIERAFLNLGEMIISPNLVCEVIAVMARQKEFSRRLAISALEKRYAFEDCPGIEAEPTQRLEDFFRQCLEEATKQGELPGKTDINDTLISLKAILVGTLLAARVDKSNRPLAYHYKRQLAILWKGLGAKVAG